MTRYFIYKGNKLVGSKIGYPTKKQASNDIDKFSTYYKLFRKFSNCGLGFGSIDEIPLGCNKCMYYLARTWEFDDGRDTYINSRWYLDNFQWNKKIWQPYKKKNYQIIKKKFYITFKNE